MEKQRIQFYANSDLKRRLEVAAAKHNMPVTEYCLNAVQKQLADDALLDAEQDGRKAKDGKNEAAAFIAELRTLHQEILAYRNGELLDVDAELAQTREERSYDLSGLR